MPNALRLLLLHIHSASGGEFFDEELEGDFDAVARPAYGNSGSAGYHVREWLNREISLVQRDGCLVAFHLDLLDALVLDRLNRRASNDVKVFLEQHVLVRLGLLV